MKSALQFVGCLTQSLNKLSRGSSWLTLGSLQEEARAISQLVKSPRNYSSDWTIKEWPPKKIDVTISRGEPGRDKRVKKPGRDSPALTQRRYELKRLARELDSSRRRANAPSTESYPMALFDDYEERYFNKVQKKKFNEAPYWHSWSPCSRKWYLEDGEVVEFEVDPKKPSK